MKPGSVPLQIAEQIVVAYTNWNTCMIIVIQECFSSIDKLF